MGLQIKAAHQNHHVDEVEQLWHYANGTRMISLTLNKLMSRIYPEILEADTKTIY